MDRAARRLIAGVLPAIAALMVVPAARCLDIPPKPATRVQDFAGVLRPSLADSLDRELARFERTTSDQIVVAIFPSLEDENLEDYAVRLFDAWDLGQAARDNGVLVAVFMKERKIRIEVGYGLESVLTDARCSRIIREDMSPRFRSGRPDLAIAAAVAEIEMTAGGAYKTYLPAPRTVPARQRGGSAGVELIVFGLFLLAILFILWAFVMIGRASSITVGPGRRRRRDDDWWYGGGGFSGGGSSHGGFSGGGGHTGGGGGFSGGGGHSGGGGASGGW